MTPPSAYLPRLGEPLDPVLRHCSTNAAGFSAGVHSIRDVMHLVERELRALALVEVRVCGVLPSRLQNERAV
eukprot:scaffold10508_cov180-Isochrysis_galbana.AAC.1